MCFIVIVIFLDEEGSEIIGLVVGIGLVDVVCCVLNDLVGVFNELIEFLVKFVIEGIDVMGDVIICLCCNGVFYFGYVVDIDVVVVVVMVFVNVFNCLVVCEEC